MRRDLGRLGQAKKLVGGRGVGPIRDRPHAHLVNRRVFAVQCLLNDLPDFVAADAAQQWQQDQAVSRAGGLENVQHGLGPLRAVGDLQADLPDCPPGRLADGPVLGFQDDGHQGRDVLRRGELCQGSQGAGYDHGVLPGGLVEQQVYDPGGPARFEHADPCSPAGRILLRTQGTENLLVDLGPVDGFQALPGRLADLALFGGQLHQAWAGPSRRPRCSAPGRPPGGPIREGSWPPPGRRAPARTVTANANGGKHGDLRCRGQLRHVGGDGAQVRVG